MFSLRRFFIAIIGSAVIINLAFLVWRPKLRRFVVDEHETSTSTASYRIKNKRDKLINLNDKCALPVLDPWEPSIKEYLNPHKNPLKGCRVSFEMRSFIDPSGLLWVLEKESTNIQTYSDDNSKIDESKEKCRYRCVDSKDGSHLIYDKWIDVIKPNMTKPGCDIFEVQCFEEGVESYKYLHGQIIPKPSLPIESNPNAPDMHIILIDGTSMSHFLRAMPLTTHYLRTDMEALMFKYMNKVGLNSRPNSYTLLLGEQAEDIEPSPWGPRKVFPGRDVELCKKSLDTENFIFYDYKKQGYKSMWNEDWWDATARWPSCNGFDEKPADHFMQAYALRFWDNKTEQLQENLFDNSCRESHNFVLDTLQDFIEKYDKKPKVSLSWMTNIAHDNANGLYHADTHFRDFFVKMRSKLSNSFVFFMSDHGNRYLLPTNTMVGEVEISNPFLFLILPEYLRKNTDLVDQLYRNTNELVNHYDLYATFLEIATNGSQWDDQTEFSGQKYSHWNRTLSGSSLLHPLDQPRTCESLKIPFQYCICQHNYKEFQDSEISLKIADSVVKRMNIEIKASEFASKCVELHVNRTATATLKLREYESQDNRRIFRVSIQTSPSQGKHDAFAEYENGEVTLISTRFARNDEYQKHAYCIRENFLRNYCYCKDLLNGNKT